MNVPIDTYAFARAQVPFARDGAFGVFTIPDVNDIAGTQDVRIAIVGDELQFFPERSSAQKRVLMALGMNA